MTQRERERKIEIERETERDRYRERQREIERDREIEREIERERQRDREIIKINGICHYFTHESFVFKLHRNQINIISGIKGYH